MTVPIAKSTPVTNASIEVSRVLAAVTMDLEADAMGNDSAKMPTIAENKVFLEPLGKRRKKEPAIYNKVRGDKKTAIAIASDGELRQLAMRAYKRDQRSEGDTSHFNYQTWAQVHAVWWSFDAATPTSILPLTLPR